MAQVFFDSGNSWLKVADSSGRVDKTRNAIAQISDSQWREAIGRRATPPDGYILVNGSPFIVGDMARRHKLRERPLGAARYDSINYSPGLAWALTTALNRNSRNVTLFASHAPGDSRYADHLKAAALGTWEIVTSAGTFKHEVSTVHTWDEPLGGFYHYVLTNAGRERANNPISDKTILFMDIGGYTSDTGAVDPGGVIDLHSLTTTRTGVINVVQNFESMLRDNNRLLFKTAGDLDERRLESAILTGAYEFGKKALDCRQEAQYAINELVSDLTLIVERMGGAANYNALLLIGGGSVLVADTLADRLPYLEIINADDKAEMMQYANVIGGRKMFLLAERHGIRF